MSDLMRVEYQDGTNVRAVLIPSLAIDRYARTIGTDSADAVRRYAQRMIDQTKEGPHTKVEDIKSDVVDHLACAMKDFAGADLVLPGASDLTFAIGGRTYQITVKQLNR